jgi:hypothetical protein
MSSGIYQEHDRHILKLYMYISGVFQVPGSCHWRLVTLLVLRKEHKYNYAWFMLERGCRLGRPHAARLG